MRLRVLHVGVVRPRDRPTPEDLLARWPTIGAVATAVAQAGVEVTVLQPFHRVAMRDLAGVTYRFVDELALPGRATGCMPWRLAAEARRCLPDVIHVNGFDFPLHIRALCGLGVPVLVQDHFTVVDRHIRSRRWGLRNVSGAVFTDERQARALFANGSLRAGLPVFAVPESSSHFTPGDQQVARAACGLRGDPAVLWVGRLNDNKDPLTILAAVEMAARHLPGLHLYCCFHEQPLLAQVQARIAASPLLAGRVELLGQVPHERIEMLARAADIFMLGSHREGSGYALIEAMACGLVPLVSDIPSFRRLTGEGTVGALVPVGDVEGFAHGLLRLAARPRDAARAAVLAHFRQHLSFARVGRRLRDIYVDMAARPR
jgi:glycosyltransferase involved in cell wall biosynthesis